MNTVSAAEPFPSPMCWDSFSPLSPARPEARVNGDLINNVCEGRSKEGLLRSPFACLEGHLTAWIIHKLCTPTARWFFAQRRLCGEQSVCGCTLRFEKSLFSRSRIIWFVTGFGEVCSERRHLCPLNKKIKIKKGSHAVSSFLDCPAEQHVLHENILPFIRTDRRKMLRNKHVRGDLFPHMRSTFQGRDWTGGLLHSLARHLSR